MALLTQVRTERRRFIQQRRTLRLERLDQATIV
jgi:hypothetical protein